MKASQAGYGELDNKKLQSIQVSLGLKQLSAVEFNSPDQIIDNIGLRVRAILEEFVIPVKPEMHI
jgi:hypothetical protein